MVSKIERISSRKCLGECTLSIRAPVFFRIPAVVFGTARLLAHGVSDLFAPGRAVPRIVRRSGADARKTGRVLAVRKMYWYVTVNKVMLVYKLKGLGVNGKTVNTIL